MTVETQEPNPQPEEAHSESIGGIEDPPGEPTDPLPEGEPPAPAPTTPEIETPPAEEPTEPDPEIEVEPEPEGDTLTIPTSAMAKIKAKEREKGRAQAIEEYESRFSVMARLLGFDSMEEMENADPEEFWKAKQGQSRSDSGSRTEMPREEPPAPEEDVSDQDDGQRYPRYTKRLESENARLLDEKRRLNQARAHEERRRRRLERELDAKDAETELRIAAGRAGVGDIDYALHLLRKDLQGKSAEELAEFNEETWFSEQLREKHPYLFSTETQPATTGPAGGETGADAPPPAGQPTVEAGSDKEVDARKMSKEDYDELLRKRGLTDPSVGMPS